MSYTTSKGQKSYPTQSKILSHKHDMCPFKKKQGSLSSCYCPESNLKKTCEGKDQTIISAHLSLMNEWLIHTGMKSWPCYSRELTHNLKKQQIGNHKCSSYSPPSTPPCPMLTWPFHPLDEGNCLELSWLSSLKTKEVLSQYWGF